MRDETEIVNEAREKGLRAVIIASNLETSEQIVVECTGDIDPKEERAKLEQPGWQVTTHIIS